MELSGIIIGMIVVFQQIHTISRDFSSSNEFQKDP